MGNIHKRLYPVYGSCAVNRSTVGHWVQRVKASGSGETELHDRPRSGRPATATSPDKLQRADDIHADRRITSRQLAVQLSVSNGSAMAIIDALGYSKVSARWIPRSLTTEHRLQRKAGDEKAVNGMTSSAITKKQEVLDNSFRRKDHDHRLLGH